MPPTHPQHLVNSLSLLGKPSSTAVQTHQSAPSSSGIASAGHPDAQAFWLNSARDIDWVKTPTVAYGQVPGDARPTWFPDGKFNTCFNALDRHVAAGYGHRIAFHHVSPLPAAVARPERSVTYQEVLDEVIALAGVLRSMGVKKGDTVVIYMPMVLEGTYAMLACARLGAIHSVVFGGFAAKELAKRISDAEPTAIVSASCGLEPKGVLSYKDFLDEAQQHTSHRAPLLMLRRKEIKGHTIPTLSRDKNELDWEEEVARVRKEGSGVKECAELSSSHPLYVLYTSGTTGLPKGVVRFGGGHAVATLQSMKYTFGLTRDSTIFCASDLGWVVGSSYIVYGPLLLGCTSVLFEGKPILPDAGVFWNIVQEKSVNCVFTAPTALRAISREDPDATLMSKYDLRSLKSIFLAGERSEPAIIRKYQALLVRLGATGAIVNDNYWSTESGSPITAIQLSTAFPPLAPRPGAAGVALPGMDVRIVDDEGKELPRGTMGNIVLATPLPPSALGTIWKNEARFHEAYFLRFEGKGGWYDSGDAGVIDEEGFVSVLSRADDIINVAGHRLGTSLIEQVVSSHPYIAECAIVGRPDALKGHLPFALVIRASSAEAQAADPATILAAVNASVRQDIGPIATLGDLVCTPRLPKTRSGKTLRRTVKDLVKNAAKGRFDAPASYPPTIEDVAVVEEVRADINSYFKGGEGKAKAKL